MVHRRKPHAPDTPIIPKQGETTTKKSPNRKIFPVTTRFDLRAGGPSPLMSRMNTRDAETKADHTKLIAKAQAQLDRLGWPLAELARATGIPYGRIHKWFDQIGSLNPSDVLRFARALGVPVDYLCDPDDPGPPTTRTADEAKLLQTIRDAGLSPAEVIPLIIEGLRRRAEESPAPPTGPSAAPLAPNHEPPPRKPKRRRNGRD